MSKNAIVTGGGSGIGLAISKELAKNGYNLLINNIVEVEESVIKELEGFGIKVFTFISNVADFDACEKLAEYAKENMETIDVLVNNAGITRDTLVLRMKEEEFDSVIDVNLKGTFNMTRHISPLMAKARCGHIINIASVVGVTGNAGQCNYAASKAGVIGITKSVARELATRNVFVNAVAPGFIETKMTEVLPEKVKEAVVNNIPLKKFGSPDDVAKTVMFLAETTYITGQVINIDGGMVM